jgi:hypothetical protein
MTPAPYLLALALLEQDGKRALPLQGQSLREPLAEGAGPGPSGERQALELLVRVWQRSESAPLRRAAAHHSLLLVTVPIEALMEQVPNLKAAWIASGDTAALIQGLQAQGGTVWSVASEPRQPLQFIPLA